MYILTTPGFNVICGSENKLLCEGLWSTTSVCLVSCRAISVHDQTPGFSTIFTNLLSSMPAAEHLLHARAAEEGMSRGPESTVVFETEMVTPTPTPVTLALWLDSFRARRRGGERSFLFGECIHLEV